MPTFRRARSLVILVVVAFASGCTTSALNADVLLFGADGYFDFYLARYDDAGNLARSYSNTADIFEESFDHFVLSPDGSTFYVLSNSLGFTSIYPFDLATGNYAGPSDGIDDYSPFDTAYCCDAAPENAVIQGHHADFLDNYLFVVSNGFFNPGLPTFPSVKMFDTITGDFVYSFPFPSSVSILDLTINQSLGFALTSDGIYYGDGSGKVINKVTGDKGVKLGPDNLLYVTNNVTREIRRYNSSGVLVDTFLTAAELGMVPQSANFGPNGDLYILGTNLTGLDILIKRFDGTTAEFISVLEIEGDGPYGPGITGFNDRFYILIPEPTTFGLSAIMLVGLFWRRTRRAPLACRR